MEEQLTQRSVSGKRGRIGLVIALLVVAGIVAQGICADEAYGRNARTLFEPIQALAGKGSRKHIAQRDLAILKFGQTHHGPVWFVV